MEVAFNVTYAASVFLCFVLFFDRRRLLGLVAENETLIKELEALTVLDELTQVGNKRLFDEQLRALAAHTLRSGEPLGLLLVDLNDLKAVNDTHGHAIGNRVLRALAEALGNSVRPTDVVCRIGGDEFAVLLPSCAQEGLRAIVARITQNLEKTNVLNGGAQIPVRVSLGGACLRVENRRVFVGSLDIGDARAHKRLPEAVRLLFSTGDTALYDAKARKGAEPMPVTLR